MRTNAALVFILAALSLVAAWAMIPREAEMALMSLRAGNYEEAETVLRRRLDDGDRSVAVMLQIVDVLHERGDVDEALKILAEVAEVNPANADAWRLLANEYMSVQRPMDALAAFGRVAELKADTESWRQVANIAGWLDQSDTRLTALRQLVSRRAAEADEYVELAQAAARAGRFAEAEAIVAAFIDSKPKEIDDQLILLLTRVLTASGGNPANSKQLMAWFFSASASQANLLFSELRRNTSALERFRSVAEERAKSDARFIRVVAAAEVMTGRTAAADQRLTDAIRSKRLPEADLPYALDVALAANNAPSALAAARAMANTGTLTTEQRLAAIGIAEQANKLADAEDLLAGLSDETLEGQPLLGARIALYRGDRNAAGRYLGKAQAQSNLALSDQLEIARIETLLGQNEAALKRLALLARQPEMPDDALVELGRLYFELGQVKDGLVTLSALRRERKSPGIDRAWALLAAKSGQESDVVAWLETAGQQDAATLTDLAYLGLDARLPRLALAAAQRLDRMQRSRDSVRVLSAALVMARRGSEALAILRPNLGSDPELESTFFDALALAGSDDEKVTYISAHLTDANLSDKRRTDLVQAMLDIKRLPQDSSARPVIDWLGSELRRDDITGTSRSARVSLLARLSPSQALPYMRQEALRDPRRHGDDYLALLARLGARTEAAEFIKAQLAQSSGKRFEELVYSLMEAGGTEAAYPYLRNLAEAQGGDWIYAFEDAAIKLNRKTDLVAFFRQRASTAALATQQRRDIAFRLLDLGEKAAAMQAFRDLAADQTFDGADVRQLLFLMGPRPDAAGLDWIVARAGRASGSEKAKWLGALNDAGAANRVVQLLEPAVPKADDPAFVQLIAAYARLGQKTRIAEMLSAAANGLSDPPRLVELGLVAEQANLPQLAEAMLGRASQLGSRDPRAVLARARAAQNAGKRSEAARLFADAIAASPEDVEVRYAYAESLLAQRRDSEAQAQFAQLLKGLAANPQPTPEQRRIKAFALYRLGQRDAARQDFDRLLTERPDDKALRADYAGLLIDAGDTETAKRILAR